MHILMTLIAGFPSGPIAFLVVSKAKIASLNGKLRAACQQVGF
jgi:hypothetical protein